MGEVPKRKKHEQKRGYAQHVTRKRVGLETLQQILGCPTNRGLRRACDELLRAFANACVITSLERREQRVERFVTRISLREHGHTFARFRLLFALLARPGTANLPSAIATSQSSFVGSHSMFILMNSSSPSFMSAFSPS